MHESRLERIVKVFGDFAKEVKLNTPRSLLEKFVKSEIIKRRLLDCMDKDITTTDESATVILARFVTWFEIENYRLSQDALSNRALEKLKAVLKNR